jgi:hypothetical protein
MSPTLERRLRLALTAALAIYGVFLLTHPDYYGFMDDVDLPIHESGHVIFGPFGEFIGFAGGTLMQLIVPAVFAVYFWRRKDRHGASVAMWWFAQSSWNVARYVQDARAQELPLVGGGEHDWAYLLGETGLLRQDIAIGHGIRVIGGLIFVAAMLLGVSAAASPATAPPPAT